MQEKKSLNQVKVNITANDNERYVKIKSSFDLLVNFSLIYFKIHN